MTSRAELYAKYRKYKLKYRESRSQMGGNQGLINTLANQEEQVARVYAINHMDEIDMNFVSPDGSTPLMVAISRGFEELAVTFAGSPDTDPNIRDNDGNTALIRAVSRNLKKVIDALVTNAKTDVNIQNNKGETAVFVAAVSGHSECLARLLPKNPDLTIPDNNGFTPYSAIQDKFDDSRVHRKIGLMLRLYDKTVQLAPDQRAALAEQLAKMSIEDMAKQ